MVHNLNDGKVPGVITSFLCFVLVHPTADSVFCMVPVRFLIRSTAVP